MKIRFSAALASIALVISSNPVLAQEDVSAIVGQDEKIETIQFMNHMNYVVYLLSSYRNVFVIEDEYRNLSPGNLNLNRIPDEEVMNAIVEMLDTIQSMRAGEKRRDFFNERLSLANQRKIQQAICSGVTTAGENLVRGGNCSSPAGLCVNVAGAVVAGLGSGFGQYVELQNKIETESANFKFEYDQEKDDKLHQQNKNQLRLQYGLTKRYGIDDKFRLSDEDAKELVEIVKSSDKKGAFTRMKSLCARKPSYNQFPMFWCHYAAFALAAGDTAEAIKACEHFKEINRRTLFKRDRMAAQIAMTEISAMIALDSIDKEKVRHALKTIEAYYSSKDVDMAYFCASTYYSVLGDAVAAKETLNGLLAALEESARTDLAKYRDLFDPGNPDQPWIAPTPVIDIFNCHMLLQSIEASSEQADFRKYIEAILERSTTASIEKLFFVGDVRVKDLWKKARPDVEAIQLRYEKHDFSSNSLVALVPISWFVLGDFPIQVDLMRGTNVVSTVKEDFKKRKIELNRPASNSMFAKIEMKCPSKDLKCIDCYALRLPHESWPVTIYFCPQAGAKIDDSEFESAVSTLVPETVEFMDMTFSIADAEPNNSTLFDAVTPRRDCAVVLAWPEKMTQLSTNDFVSIVCDNHDLIVAWTNSTDHTGVLELQASGFNRYGAKYCDMVAEENILPGSSGSTKLVWPNDLAGCCKPDVVILSERKTKSLGQQGNELKDKLSSKGKSLTDKLRRFRRNDNQSE